MNDIKSFTLYKEFFKLINTLKPIQKRDEFIGKILDYYFKDIEPIFEDDSDEEAIWENISRPIKQYKINALNGLKGGRPKTETETQKKTESLTEMESTSKIVNVNSYSNKYIELFNKFYILYPKKKSKEKTKGWFIKNKPSEELFKTIIDSLNKHIKSKEWRDKQYIPYPSTWLNQRMWEDEVEEDITQQNGKEENIEIPDFNYLEE
jgi:hypothetical protein